MDEYTENYLSLLRSKIRELHPVHRASLEALFRPLLHVASYSDKNGMTVKVLSSQLCKYVLGYDTVFSDGNHAKARYIDLSQRFPADTPTETGYGGSDLKYAYLVRRANF